MSIRNIRSTSDFLTYVNNLAGMTCRDQMRAAEATFEQEGYDEFDRITERSALIDAEVDIELAVRMKNLEAIEDVIADNADALAKIVLNGKDLQTKIPETIAHWIRGDIEREMGL